MTRRYKPSMIQVTRADTERADMFRERAKPAPAPFVRPEPPAPAEEPTRQPKPGRPKNLTPPPLPRSEGSAVLSMFDQAMEGTTDPAVKRRLRAAQRQMSTQIKNDVPPGAHPDAYGY